MKISVASSSFILVLFMSNIDYMYSDEKLRILSRRKRYLVFPEGASLTVAFCFTINLIEVPTNIFTEVINFGINYDLPNKTLYDYFPKKVAERKELVQRRHRRDLYNKVEIILNKMGYDGRICIYRALCEAAQNFASGRDNLLEEIISRMFRFPLEKILNYEPEDHRLYHWAYRMGFENRNCFELFPKCDINLLDVILGYKKRI